MIRRAAVLLTLVVVASAAWAQRPVVGPRPIVVQRLSLPDTLRGVLVQRNVPAAKQTVILAQFKAYPIELQHTLLAAMDDKYAVEYNMPAWRLVTDRIRPDLLKPNVSAVWPSWGTPPNNWIVVMGTMLMASDKVLWDGVERPTTYFGPDAEFFPNSLCIQVPAGTPLATDHTVKVRRNPTVESNSVTYRVCATRGYRGIYGWKFANFGNPTIAWHLYRDFFGQPNVEYANGVHRPAAQAWYDASYKGVGGGGNCYGMSNSSLRLRNSNMTTFHRNWFTGNPRDFCWLYDWGNETRESVQEDQGGQLSAEMAATINDYWNNQDHKEAWTRIDALKNEAVNRPVVCFWGPDWGHAVVGYGTTISGTQRGIQWYDNNEPYAENEVGGPDKSTAYVDWNNSSFHANSYGSASRMIALSYNECMRAPHLPASATGAGAMGTVVAVVEGGSVQQIEDENGRRFFAANGAENTDPNTRIPNSMKFIPIQGGRQPYSGPAIFIFNNATNKNLTFTVGGGGQKSLNFFQPGNVFRTQFAGTGQLKLNRILTPTRSLELPNPTTLQPSLIRLIHVRPSERVFDLQNLNLGANPAVVSIVGDAGDGVEVQTGAAGRFDLRTETFAANQVSQGLFRNIATQAGSRAQLTPTDWNNLRGATLNLNLRSLNNQPIQQLRINQ